MQNQIEAGSKKYQISITKTGLTAEDAIKNAMDAAKAWGRSILTPNMTSFEKNVKTIVINANNFYDSENEAFHGSGPTQQAWFDNYEEQLQRFNFSFK